MENGVTPNDIEPWLTEITGTADRMARTRQVNYALSILPHVNLALLDIDTHLAAMAFEGNTCDTTNAQCAKTHLEFAKELLEMIGM